VDTQPATLTATTGQRPLKAIQTIDETGSIADACAGPVGGITVYMLVACVINGNIVAIV
jgi:hypothetical protein